MSTPEVTALAARADAQDESMRAIADTLLEVNDKVDEHSVTLAEHTATLAEHTTTLAEHGEMLREILRRLPPAM